MSYHVYERYDKIGKIRIMTSADGYCMCRRPGCMPFVMKLKEWEALSNEPIHRLRGEKMNCMPLEKRSCKICKHEALSASSELCRFCDTNGQDNFDLDYNKICKWCYNPCAPNDNVCEEHRKSHAAHSWPGCIVEDQKKQFLAHEAAEKKARRERIAVTILNSLLNNDLANKVCEDAIIANDDITRKDWFAEQAIDFADAMIAALDEAK